MTIDDAWWCLMTLKVFHVSRTPPYGQWPIDIHKNIILSGGSSQIDGLEAGDFTFEDSNLIRWMSVVRKCVKTTFYHLIRRESSKVKLPASKPSIWLLPPLRMMFLWVSIGHCPYGGGWCPWHMEHLTIQHNINSNLNVKSIVLVSTCKNIFLIIIHTSLEHVLRSKKLYQSLVNGFCSGIVCRFTLKKFENLSLGNCKDIDVFLNQVEFHYFVRIFFASFTVH